MRIRIDKVAVEIACNGTPMSLNQHERAMVVRRMNGMVSTREVARRCRVSDREIVRTLHRLGAKKCPACKQLCFDTDGVLQRHIDLHSSYALSLCILSGRRRDQKLRRVSAVGGHETTLLVAS